MRSPESSRNTIFRLPIDNSPVTTNTNRWRQRSSAACSVAVRRQHTAIRLMFSHLLSECCRHEQLPLAQGLFDGMLRLGLQPTRCRCSCCCAPTVRVLLIRLCTGLNKQTRSVGHWHNRITLRISAATTAPTATTATGTSAAAVGSGTAATATADA